MHINGTHASRLNLDERFFSEKGAVQFANIQQAKIFFNELKLDPTLSYQELYSFSLINEIFSYLWDKYVLEGDPNFVKEAFAFVSKEFGKDKLNAFLEDFLENYPLLKEGVRSQKDDAIFECILLFLNNTNTALERYFFLIKPSDHKYVQVLKEITEALDKFLAKNQKKTEFETSFIDLISSPQVLFPHSLQLQLEYIKSKFGHLIGDLLLKMNRALDFLHERNQYFLKKNGGFGPGPSHVMDFKSSIHEEYEKFSQDKDWMPRVVLLAKTTLVWLYQLSIQYNRQIDTLDKIPEEEIRLLSERGFNCLWLIGLWERSEASKKIKNWCGNPEAAASAYSLYDYQIAGSIGGWQALESLKNQCLRYGIRLASDMVPNHTGIESQWLYDHPDWYIQTSHPPFPSYTYGSGNLSNNPDIEVVLEDHYYARTDAAVTFKMHDKRNGQTRYIYHGNDGTSMPWNDTAQLNYLLPEVREAIIQQILSVARNFSVIRFDAAMTLAKRHIQRLWFPEPGHGGDIPSRSEYGLSNNDFNAKIPVEFWREVVDRVAQEVPDTLLLAEAFWMMEGYFVRTLGMHRVYNSAFMNMLKNEDNSKYRASIKNVLTFDKDILKRFVNFMNNPDEDTAYAQFGDSDKYFGVCTLMATLPGLPMFGHGQVERYTEKYGMEYQKAYKDEKPLDWFVERHERDIFPILKMRNKFSGSEHFNLYDFIDNGHQVNENVYAFSNRSGEDHSVVVFNNSYTQCSGTVLMSVPYLDKYHPEKKVQSTHIARALGIPYSGEYFTLFRNAKTNMWFMRSSKQIHEQGISFILNGYESQVFVDFYSLKDNDLSYYAKIHHRLNGASFKNIDDLVREEFLAPLYSKVKMEFDSAKGQDPKAVITNLVKIIQDQKYYDFTHAELDALAKIEDDTKRIEDNCRYLIAVLKKEKDLFETHISKISIQDVLFTRFLIIVNRANDYWKLENEISLNKDLKDRIHHYTEFERFVAASKVKTDYDNFENPLVKNFLEVHEFEGTLYFNKESLLMYLIFYFDDKKSTYNIAEIYKAMTNSNYDYDVFCELLKPKKKTVKKSK